MKYRYDIKSEATGEIQSLDIALSQTQIDLIERSRETQGLDEADALARLLVEQELHRSRKIPDGFRHIGRPLLMSS